jgi:hypothetical protein
MPYRTLTVSLRVTVRLAALDDIIDSKQWANRPKDREALGELRSRLEGTSHFSSPTPARGC